MRFNKRALFRKNDLDGEVVPVNLTSMGANQQQLVFGNVKQERVVARFQRPMSVRTGYFTVNDKTSDHYEYHVRKAHSVIWS